MTEIKFNMNCYARAKLTPEGLQLLDNYKKDLLNQVRKFCPEYEIPKDLEVDSEGNIRMQLWELSHIFGPGLTTGSFPPFNMNIILETES